MRSSDEINFDFETVHRDTMSSSKIIKNRTFWKNGLRRKTLPLDYFPQIKRMECQTQGNLKRYFHESVWKHGGTNKTTLLPVR